MAMDPELPASLQDKASGGLTLQHLREELSFFAENALAEALARERKLFAAHVQNDVTYPCRTHVVAEDDVKTDAAPLDCCTPTKKVGKVDFLSPEASPSAASNRSPSHFGSEDPLCPGIIDSAAPPVRTVATTAPTTTVPDLKHSSTTQILAEDEQESLFARRHYKNKVAAEELRNMEKDVASHNAARERISQTRGSILAMTDRGSVVPVDTNGAEIPMDPAFGQFCKPGGRRLSPRRLCTELPAMLCGSIVCVQAALLRAVSNANFDYAVGLLIFVNAACIGAQTDYAAQHIGSLETQPYESLEWIFCISFSAELFARIAAYNTHFFVMPGRGWNVFDCILVGTQIAEQVMASGGGGFSAMRILRILRVVRIVRLVRVLRLIGELRTIVICVAGSMRSLFWTVVLLLVMIYIMAVYFTQVVSDFRVERGDTAAEVALVRYYFGSLGRSVLSLYQAMSGGISWDQAVSPLMLNIDPFLGVVFALYIAFALLAIMNVVTGVFVETALETAKNDKEVSLVHHTRELFSVGDKDHSGSLNWDEFEGLLDSREMSDLFNLIGIDASEAKALFQLLDLEESGTISFDDFLNGCLRLRGTAKSIDLMTVMYETRRLARNQFRQIKSIQKALGNLCDNLGHPEPSLHMRKCTA